MSIYQAVRENNVEEVILLLRYGRDFNKHDYKKSHHVANERKRKLEMFKLLMQHRAEMKEKLFIPCLPHLSTGSTSSKTNLFKLLLDNESKIQSEFSTTILHLFCLIQNNTDNIRFLLERDSKTINDLDRNNSTPLHYAVMLPDNTETVALLLQHGSNVNAKNEQGNTPLHEATRKPNNTEMIKLLLKSGADVNVQDKHNDTPFHHAVRYQKLEILKMILDRGADINSEIYLTILNEACKEENNMENIKFLIELGVRINDLGRDGETPLHNLIRREKNVEVVKLLLNNGSDINKKNRLAEQTPLYQAVRDNNFKMAKFLVKNGANLNITDSRNLSPLFSAVDYGKNTDIVKFLLERGADVKATKDDETIFCWAVNRRPNLKIIQLLLEYGADPTCSPRLFRIINCSTQDDWDISGYEKQVIFHLIQLNMLGMVSDEQFAEWKLLDLYQQTNVQTFVKACEKGAKKLLNELICQDRIVTFADLLTKDLRTVAFYLNVEDIMARVSETVLIRKFPIYSDMLEERIMKATELADFLGKGYQSLKFVLGDNRLPHTFLNQILNCLTDKDINHLNIVFESSNNYS